MFKAWKVLNEMPLEGRSSGILLPIHSLPSTFGIGDLGPWAYEVVSKLREARQRYWQVLPLSPTTEGGGNSPYTSYSAFAGNTLLISPEMLASEGLIDASRLDEFSIAQSSYIDYASVTSSKKRAIELAFANFRKRRDLDRDYYEFCRANSGWLDDYAFFKAYRDVSGKPWNEWPPCIRDRERDALRDEASRLAMQIEKEKFAQFIFFRQWGALKHHCASQGVRIIGDLPFYVSYDSSDVWSHPQLFKLDERRLPRFVSGVPPDYFSATGQLWGHPVYDWDAMREEGFKWWLQRISHLAGFFDLLRIDHFRGLLACWEVPSAERTAVNGMWVRTPSDELFSALKMAFPSMPFIAEDLGVITEDVKEAILDLGLPGMRVLVFAFDGDSRNPHLPENHPPNSVAYTGTHDTNTVLGWFRMETTAAAKRRLSERAGKEVTEGDVSWIMVRLAEGSPANLCIIPVQDLLSLGEEARTNDPAKPQGNYRWRLTEKEFSQIPSGMLMGLTEENGRC